jgi:predicted DNA binding CopG/RHH family protein
LDALNGENLGSYIMKKPNLKNLKLDAAETKRIHKSMALQRSIKITININSEILAKLKDIAEESGIPYQRLINRILAENLSSKLSNNSERLDRVERELAALKRKIAP